MNAVQLSVEPEHTTREAPPSTPHERGREEVLRDGTHICVRPIHPEDLDLERRFIEGMSETSRRFRFLETMRSPTEALLRQMTVIDASTDVAYVALLGSGTQAQQIGVARFSARPGGNDCEFAVAVADAWQHEGLGTILMHHLIEAARTRGIKEMHSGDDADNELMRKFADRLNFKHRRDPDDACLVIYSVDVPGELLVLAGSTAENGTASPSRSWPRNR